MRCLFALAIVALLAGCATETGVSTGRVVVDLEDGSQVAGRLLSRDARMVYVAIGDDVLAIPRDKITTLSEPDGSSEKTESDIEHHSLYATGTGTVRSVSAFSDLLGPAIVTVRTPSGLGTGWFCHRDGYVITNNHVVAGERTIAITAFRSNGDRMEKVVYRKVKLVALDDSLDLALLHIEEDLGFEVPQLIIGDSAALHVGDPVFTIGNPLGLERTTSDGTVSKVNRKMDGRLYLQMTTPIAPGNSGGPLFNERGEVVGVANMGYIFLDGLAFAIPSKYVKEFLDNVEAFAYDTDNPNSGTKYLEAPLASVDGKIHFTRDSFVKVGSGVECLTAADINNDGVLDIVYANNNEAHIGVVTRRKNGAAAPETTDFEDINRLPENWDFDIRTHAVRNRISSIAVGDITGNGKTDIVFAGDIDGVAIMEQREDGAFAEPRTIPGVSVSPRRDALALRDFDGDGKPEVFALGRTQFSIVHNDQETVTVDLGGQWQNVIRNYDIVDVNGDGRNDIVFLVADYDYAAHVFLQDDNGHFVRDEYVAGNLTADARRLETNQGPHTYITVDPGLNRVRTLTLKTETRPAREGTINTSISAVTFGSEGASPPDYALADVNSDGKVDMVTVDRAGSEFVIIMRNAHGWSTVRSPAPRNVSALAVYQFEDSRTILVCFSKDDKMFGLSRVTAEGVSFPRPLNIEGEVQSLQVEDLDGRRTLVWVTKEGNAYNMASLAVEDLKEPAFADASGSIDVEPTMLQFSSKDKEPEAKLPKKPERVAFADFNGDDKLDAVIHWAYSGKQGLYLGAGEGRFSAIIDESKFLDEEQGTNLLVADFDADGRRDVLLPQGDFVRVLRVDDKGKLYVESQFNWSLEGIKKLVPYGSETTFLALPAQKATILEFDKDAGTFKRRALIDLAGIESEKIEARDMDGDGEPDIVAVGVNAVQFAQHSNTRRALAGRTVLDVPTETFSYWRAWPADLDADGADEILLFDSRKAMFEIRRVDKNSQLQLACRHRLFEKTISQSSESDSLELPAELAVADVDGNGAADLVFLLQDRLAIYLQAAE